jgi:hypothetical protein
MPRGIDSFRLPLSARWLRFLRFRRPAAATWLAVSGRRFEECATVYTESGGERDRIAPGWLAQTLLPLCHAAQRYTGSIRQVPLSQPRGLAQLSQPRSECFPFHLYLHVLYDAYESRQQK